MLLAILATAGAAARADDGRWMVASDLLSPEQLKRHKNVWKGKKNCHDFDRQVSWVLFDGIDSVSLENRQSLLRIQGRGRVRLHGPCGGAQNVQELRLQSLDLLIDTFGKHPAPVRPDYDIHEPRRVRLSTLAGCAEVADEIRAGGRKGPLTFFSLDSDVYRTSRLSLSPESAEIEVRRLVMFYHTSTPQNSGDALDCSQN